MKMANCFAWMCTRYYTRRCAEAIASRMSKVQTLIRLCKHCHEKGISYSTYLNMRKKYASFYFFSHFVFGDVADKGQFTHICKYICI